jgi:hypothetical protein
MPENDLPDTSTAGMLCCFLRSNPERADNPFFFSGAAGAIDAKEAWLSVRDVREMIEAESPPVRDTDLMPTVIWLS